jgi:hypothetical protein
MEKFGFDYATEKGYDFPKQPGMDGKLGMSDLFHMTAGTSTGSIIAAGLTYPKGPEDMKAPGFSSDTILDLYKNKGDKIFVKKKMSGPIKAAIGVIIIILCAMFGFSLGNHWYDNAEVELSFIEMEQAISDLKRKRKGETLKPPRDRNKELYEMHVSFLSKIWRFIKLCWRGFCSCMSQFWRSFRNCLGFEEGEDMMSEQPKSVTLRQQLLAEEEIIKDTATQKMRMQM